MTDTARPQEREHSSRKSDAEHSASLRTKRSYIFGISSYESNAMKSRNPGEPVVSYNVIVLTNRAIPTGTVTETLIAESHGAIPMVVQEYEAIGFGGYNACITGDKSAAIGVNCGMSTGRNGVITSIGFCPEEGAKARSIGVGGER